MHFLTIYSKEAHPISERPGKFTYDAEVNPIDQPTTYQQRVALAAKTIAEEEIIMLVLVDEIDNPLWCSYGRLPNNAYLIGQDGFVNYYQKWNDAADMEVAIQRYFIEH